MHTDTDAHSRRTHLGVVVIDQVEVDPQLPHAQERVPELEAGRTRRKRQDRDDNAEHQSRDSTVHVIYCP